MGEQILTVGGRSVSLGEAIALAAAVVAVLAIVVLVVAWRRAAGRAERGRAFEGQVADLVRAQTAMQGRMQTIAEVFGPQLSERMDGLSHKLGQSMTEATRNTHDNLSRLNERLVKIDEAQQKIATLSSQVVELQKVLADKQTRGAFGQQRMEAIIQDGLPAGAYAFQSVLSNNSRPDCLVRFPNNAPALVVDAKFPLEAWNAIRQAETPDAKRAAQAQLKRDALVHIKAIRERYFIPGETQATALMFVPSESIYADLCEHFEDVVQEGYRRGVMIVSPTLLLLAIQAVQSVLKDARMREQAHLIRDEVGKLMQDVSRLDERVRKLQDHFRQTNQDVDQILISTDRIARHGEKIKAVELEDVEPPSSSAQPADELPELPFRPDEPA